MTRAEALFCARRCSFLVKWQWKSWKRKSWTSWWHFINHSWLRNSLSKWNSSIVPARTSDKKEKPIRSFRFITGIQFVINRSRIFMRIHAFFFRMWLEKCETSLENCFARQILQESLYFVIYFTYLYYIVLYMLLCYFT